MSFAPTGFRPYARAGFSRASRVYRSVGARVNFSIQGITCTAAGGAALGACTVDLFVFGANRVILTTTSDASGNFRFDTTVTGPFFIRAYKAGTPDLAGVTVNNLMAA